MKATGDLAAEKFEEFVKIANGDSLLVYKALTHKSNLTDEEVIDFIKQNLNLVKNNNI